MDNVTYIFEIYKSCDPNNTDSVPVSSLLNFMKPFLSDNLNELKQLKTQLDPDGKDPAVDSDFFHSVMSDWIAKIDKEDGGRSLSNMAKSVGVGEETSLSSVHSTLFTNELSPNVSKLADTSNNNIIALEEQIRELQHQLHKSSKELELVKQQLAYSEEQNESLSHELNKLHKLQSRDQQINEENAKSRQENEEIKEEANAANKKIQQLEKVVAHLEKQNRYLVDQVNEFENENGFLKLKIQKLEKGRSDSMKNISDLEDAVESKDAEIATLLEVIDELKCKFDEKSDLASFYMNENKLSKQKAEALENLLNDMFPDEVFSPRTSEAAVGPVVYNSPKLLNQLSHPITPTMDSPINFKKCSTSSPIKNVNTSADLFSSAGIVTVLRSPHKTLKEELSEVSNTKVVNEHEIERLKGVLKDQETVTNNLWDSMRRLSQDNESLREYKQGFEELAFTLQEKDEIIEHLQNEVHTFKIRGEGSCCKEDKSIETDLWQERDELIQCLTEELHQQKAISSDLKKKLEENIVKLDKCVETEIDNELIQHLKNEIQVLQDNLEFEKSKNMSQRKELLDKCIETDKDQIIWTIPVSNISDSKRTNYAKQQMKLERLLEKQENVEKELTSERGVNRTLRSQVEQLQEENIHLKENLELAESNQNKLLENIKILEAEQQKLQQEKISLANEKFILDQDLQTNLNKLGVEKTINQELLVEKGVLLKRIHQFEVTTRQECIKEFYLKKQIIDLKTAHDLEIGQLKKELSKKENVIFNLQSQSTSVERCLIMMNENITCVMSHILTQFKLNNELGNSLIDVKGIDYELEGTSTLIEQTNMLNGNVKSVLQLLNIMENKCFDLQSVETPLFSETYNVSQSVTSSSIDEFLDSRIDTPPNSIEEDDSFITCFSELPDNECLDVITFESDSFLDNLELNDWDLRNLSHKEMEDKFTTLALTLTVDFSTLNKRYLNERDKCNQMFIKFFTYLNCLMDLVKQLKPNDQIKVDNTTKLLKTLSEEIFMSAFQCGVFQYEKRTVNCWKLVIKYVAALSQESRELKKNQRSGEIPNIAKTLTTIQLHSQIKCTDKNEFSIQPRSDPWKKFKCYIVSFFLLVFVLFIMIIFYVDYLCLKSYGKRVCPIEWLFSLLVKRVLSHQVW